jgi:hypothetical protein
MMGRTLLHYENPIRNTSTLKKVHFEKGNGEVGSKCIHIVL